MFSSITRREALRRVGLLAGGALSATTISAVLAGCQGRAAGDPAYAFQALDADGQALTARLVDLIIPETDTPGARAAGAHEFIDKMLADWVKPDDRDRFMAGLADVDARAQQAHGSRFVDVDEAGQVALLTRLDQEAYGPRPPAEAEEKQEATTENAQAGTDAMQRARERQTGQIGEADTGEPGGDAQAAPPPPRPPVASGPPFFRTLKELTLAGYYTSEIGATQELRWSPNHGSYQADIPFSDVGRAWA